MPAGLTFAVSFGAFNTFATSLGLDRPIWNILNEIRLALDPGTANRTGWNLAGMRHPCSYAGNVNSGYSPNYGAGLLWWPSATAWTGITCADQVLAPNRAKPDCRCGGSGISGLCAPRSL